MNPVFVQDEREFRAEPSLPQKVGAFLFALCGVFTLSLAVVHVAKPLFASGPSSNRVLNYQIRLTDASGIPLEGTQNVKLSFYTAASGGTPVHTDCGTTGTPVARKIVVAGGAGSVLIGDTAAPGATNCADASQPNVIPASLFNNTSLYLGVTVGADAEMTPRKRIVAQGYALNADMLDDLDTSAVGGVVAFVPVTDPSGNLVLTRNFTVDGTTLFVDATNNRVGMGEGAPDSQLEIGSAYSAGAGADYFVVDVNPTVTAGANDQVASLMRLRHRGGTGGFTNVRMPLLVSENSGGGQFKVQLFEAGLRIGNYTGGPASIAAPAANLELDGFGSSSATFAMHVENAAGADVFSIRDDGNVGVGTFSPADKLHVTGNTVVIGDYFLDSDGATSSFNGVRPTAIAENAALTSAAGQGLCTDSLTLPTRIYRDGNGDCVPGNGGTDAVILMTSTSAAVTVTSAWAFNDADTDCNGDGTGGDASCTAADGIYQTGQDLFIDREPTLVYTSGNVGIGTTTPSANFRVVGAGAGDYATFPAVAVLEASDNSVWNLAFQNRAAGLDKIHGFYLKGAPSTTFDSNAGTLLLANGNIADQVQGWSQFDRRTNIGTFGTWSTLAVRSDLDKTDIGGTTTASASTTITGVGTLFLRDLGVGDRISLSSAATTYATVTAIASDTSLTVDTALGNGASQTINRKSGIMRLDNSAGVGQLMVNDQGRVGIGTAAPGASLHVAGGNILQTVSTSPTIAGSLSHANFDSTLGVYVSGRYAYVVGSGTTGDRLNVVDVTRPTAPVLVGSSASGGTLDGANEVLVAGKYAYVVSSSGDAMTILDVSNPSSPTVVGSVSGTDYDNAQGIALQGKYVYTTAINTDTVAIVDVSNPAAPVQAGKVTSATIDGPVGVAVQGKYAYVTAVNADRLAVLDVSNPAAPTIVGSVTSAQLDGAASVYVSGRHAYVASVNADSLTIIDVSNPTAPTQVGTVTASSLDFASKLVVSGRYAYVTSQTADSFTVIDVSDPAAPSIVTSLSSATIDAATGIRVAGKYAYVTGRDSDTLAVIDIAGIDAPSASIGDIWTSSLNVAEDVDVANSLYVRSGVNVGPGGLYVDEGEVAFDGNSGTTAFRFGQKGTGDILNVFDNTTEVLTILDGGNVGIGATAPATKLVVAGQTRVGEGAATFSDFGLTYQLVSNADRTDTSGTYFGAYSRLAQNPASASTAASFGLTGTVELNGTQNQGSATGVNASISKLGSGTATALRSVNAFTYNGSGSVTTIHAIRSLTQSDGGTATNVYGLQYQHFSSGGTATNSYGVRVESPSLSGGAITNLYGVYVDPQTAGGTSNFGFLYNHGSSPFAVTGAGSVGVGTSNPASFKLQVDGSVGPNLDDTYDLGSNVLRWRDLYLGPATLHIGTAVGDEAVLTYDTGTNALNIDSTGTVEINGGSGASGCSVDASGNFSCSGTVAGGGGAAFQNGGNSFGGTATLGTNDSFNLAFETAGATRMTLDTSGNVGIGTASPNVALTVGAPSLFSPLTDILASVSRNGASQNAFFLASTDTSGEDAGIIIGTRQVGEDSAIFMDQSDARKLKFSLGLTGDDSGRTTNTRMTIDQTGRVGIGTTNPYAAQLHVDKATVGGIGGAIMITNTATATVGSRARLGFDLGGFEDIDSLAAIDARLANAGTGATDLIFNAYDGSGSLTNYERMRIVGSSGNVGIGTAAPVARLHIISVDDVAIPGHFESKDNDGTEATITVNNTGGGFGVPVISLQEDTVEVGNVVGHNAVEFGLVNGITLSSASGRDIGFRINNSTEAARITTGGFMGIGIAGPASRLDVRGSNTTEWIRVRSNASGTAGSFDMYSSGTGGFQPGTTGFNSTDGAAILLNVGGTERMRVHTNGNVGIGDSSPTALFTVGSGDKFTVDSAGTQTLGSSSADPTGANGRTYYNTTLNTFRCFANGGWMDCDSNVGIGSSLGITQSVVTGSRAFATVYQNTTGKPLFVSVTAGRSATGTIQAYTDSSATPTTIVAGQSDSSGYYSNLFFVVPPTHYYKVTNDTSATVSFWTESTLDGSGASQWTTNGSDIYFASGNVGIGTSTPITQLHVRGQVPTSVGTVATSSNPLTVKVQGNYAYVVSYTGRTLRVYDVSTSTMVQKGTVALADTSRGQGMDVQGRYAYVVTYDSHDLQIFDISNPSLPTLVGDSGAVLSNPHAVRVQGRYAYVVNPGDETLKVVDVSDPTAPTVVGSVTVGTDPYSIFVQGRYAYVTNDPTGDTLQVVDVSVPSAPVVVGSVAAGSDPTEVYVSGRYAYVVSHSDDTLRIFDVANPAAPVSVGTLTVGDGPLSINVQGHYAYITLYLAGQVQVVDVSNPTAPVSVGTVAVGSNPGDGGFDVQGRFLYVTNFSSNTLQKLDLGGTYVQQVEAGGLLATELSVATHFQTLDADIRGGLMVGGNSHLDGSLSVFRGLVANGLVVFNEAGSATADFRVEGDTNTNLLFVDASTDRVGIGTSTPDDLLEVENGHIRISNGADIATLHINGDTANDTDVGEVDARIRFSTDNNPNQGFLIDTVNYLGYNALHFRYNDVDSGDDGYRTLLTLGSEAAELYDVVGIGTRTPGSTFEVAQPSTGPGTVTTAGTTALVGFGTQFTDSFKVGDTVTVEGETVRTIATITNNTNLTVSVAFSTSASGLSYTLTGGTRLVVKGNGNVGIGETAPTFNLDVNGSSGARITGPSMYGLMLKSSHATSDFMGIRWRDNANANLWSMGNDWFGDGADNFWLFDNATGRTPFFADGANGLFGIYTDNTPTATLDVKPVNRSGASGLTRGWFQVRSGTYTDNATAASGTAASYAFAGIQQPTLAATNASVTTTDAATLYVANAPAAGANMTITNPYALWVDNGNARLDGSVGVGGVSVPFGKLQVDATAAGSFAENLWLRNGAAATLNSSANIVFAAASAAGSTTRYAEIRGMATDVSSNPDGALTFHTMKDGGGNERMRIDADGRVGINVVPTSNTLQVENAVSNGNVPILSKYLTSSTTGPFAGLAVLSESSGDMADTFGAVIEYQIKDAASAVQTIGRAGFVRDGNDGLGRFTVNPIDSGSPRADAFNVQWGDATGPEVGIGITDPATALHVVVSDSIGTVPPILRLQNTTDHPAADVGIRFNSFNQDFAMGIDETDDSFRVVDGTDLTGTARMIIDTDGLVGIGATPVAKLHVSSTYTVGTASQDGQLLQIDSNRSGAAEIRGLEIDALELHASNTGSVYGLDLAVTQMGTAATSVRGIEIDASAGGSNNTAILYGVKISDASSSGSSQGDHYGIRLDVTTGTGGNHYGVYSNVGGGTNAYAGIFTGGNVGIGDTTPDARLDVEMASATVAIFDRLTDDGTIIDLQQDGTSEGTISVSGNTVSYNAFTGSHYAWIDAPPEKGMLVTLTGDNRRLHGRVIGEMLYGIAPASEENDAKVLGAYLALQEPNMPVDDSNPHLVMAVGNGDVWVVDGGQDVAIGDYLIASSTPGHAVKDPGTADVSHVVARAAEPVDWETVTEFTANGKKRKLVSVTFESFSSRNVHPGVFGAKLSELTVDAGLDMRGYGVWGVSSLRGIGDIWSIDDAGKLVVKDIVTDQVAIRQTDAKSTLDTSKIPSGQDYAQVHNAAVNAATRVFVTFRKNPGSAWWVEEVTEGLFVVKTALPVTEDVAFDYWLVQTLDERTAPQAAAEEPSAPEPAPEPQPEPPPASEPKPVPEPEPQPEPQP